MPRPRLLRRQGQEQADPVRSGCVSSSIPGTRHISYIGSMIANGIVYYLLYDTRYNYTLSAHFQASLIFDVSLHSHSPHTRDTCAHVSHVPPAPLTKRRLRLLRRGSVSGPLSLSPRGGTSPCSGASHCPDRRTNTRTIGAPPWHAIVSTCYL